MRREHVTLRSRIPSRALLPIFATQRLPKRRVPAVGSAGRLALGCAQRPSDLPKELPSCDPRILEKTLLEDLSSAIGSAGASEVRVSAIERR